MSENLPEFKVGQRVRIMNTSTNQELGIANIRGKVVRILGGDKYTVLSSRAKVSCHASGMMLTIEEMRKKDRERFYERPA